MVTLAPNGYLGVGRGSGDVNTVSYSLHMRVSGAYVTEGGVWTNASSREYKENIEELSSNDAMLALNDLKPVTFKYKTDDEHHIGFIAEDVPDIVATKDRKGLSPMDMVALLTKIVQEQQKTIVELSDRVKSLENQTK
ncbi:tail fiber domain-containing protein [Candidatus Magnetobacterium casense]|uniref:Tail fiber domain-containing protein n=1 Tax=Candidatus Magnetobacterium casense TaxID=1455061 RepID=A0ABS6S3V9_9BACT|nr:tail fiber domain-containing protein [Candidatus Magnetobacterium casensis]MBV6343549.1 tail fiber domain-containing protein [Candidatus Magnetobacterium casensis]